MSWEAKFDLARSSGFDFLEMSIDGTDERLRRLYADGTVAEVNRAVRNSGFPVRTMAFTANRAYPLGSEDDAVRGKAVEIVRLAVDFSLASGIRLIHLAAYDEHGERCNARTEKLFFESLHECVRYAARCGVMLALEIMDVGFMADGGRISEAIRAVDSPYLQCYADVGNLTASGADPYSEILKLGRHIVGLHLKDARRGVCRDVPFGEGIVDFDLCLDALAAIDYRGFMVAEMWSYDDESFHPYLARANAFLRQKLSRAALRVSQVNATYEGDA
jgi:predicted hexulose-6-phosphate isomerase